MELLSTTLLTMGIIGLAYWKENTYLKIIGALVAISFGLYWMRYAVGTLYIIEGLAGIAIGIYMLISEAIFAWRSRG